MDQRLAEFKPNAFKNYKQVVLSELKEAILNMNKAIRILNSDLKINGKGYRTDEMKTFCTDINDICEKINTRILPSIEKIKV